MSQQPAAAKARRRSDRAFVAAYHEATLAELLEPVRAGFAASDAGTIDAVDLAGIIHQDKRTMRQLWWLGAVSGSHVERVARTLELRKAEGVEQDWWEAGAPERR